MAQIFGNKRVEEVEAESAGKIKYQVRDFLQDRHPYVPSQGFQAIKAREKGLVSDGFLPTGYDTLFSALEDSSIDVTQRTKALQHLMAHSAAAENKIKFMRKGLIPILANLLNDAPIAAVELQCCLIMRSLAILPQGGHLLVHQKGVQALLTMLKRDSKEDRRDARVAAVSALCQISTNWDGRAWLLGLDVPVELQLLGVTVENPLGADEMEQQAQATCDTLVQSMSSSIQGGKIDEQMLQHAVHALALLTSVERGLQMTLIAGGLREASNVLSLFVKSDAWVYSEVPLGADIVLQTVTMVWHIGLDDIGLNEAMDLPLVPLLGQLLSALKPVKDRLFPLKAAITGASCALLLHPQLKKAALESIKGISGETPLVLLIIELLKQTNAMFLPLRDAKKKEQPLPYTVPTMDDCLPVMKNSVQAVRFVAELPAGADFLQKSFSSSAEDYEVKRQLFAATNFEEKFNVSTFGRPE